MLADGLEAIVEAWRFLHKRGIEKPEYLRFCQKAAEWLVAAQNADGSYYRAYYADGSIRMLKMAPMLRSSDSQGKHSIVSSKIQENHS